MTRRQRREEQQNRYSQHRHLRAHAGAATVRHQHAERSGEPEARMIERQAKRNAHNIERRHARPLRVCDDDSKRNDRRQRGDDRTLAGEQKTMRARRRIG